MRKAAEAGLGAVRRVHRQRRDWPDWTRLAPGIPLFGVAVGAVAVFDWRSVFLLPVLAWAGLVCWVHLAPLPGPHGPRLRFAVCEGGVLVLSRAAPVAIPWEALTTPKFGVKRTMRRLVWTDGADERHLDVGPVSGGRDLGRAVASRGPVRARVGPRLAVVAVGAATLALVGWMAQPWLVRAVLGEKPEHLEDLARLCSPQGRPFDGVAPYEGAGPHPLVFFGEGAGRPDLATTGGGRARPEPDEVQLVACGQPAGRVSDTPLQVCDYQGGLRLESYQGRRHLDVFEARTGRRVGRQTLTGPGGAGKCAPSQLVHGDPPYTELRRTDTSPPMSEYEAALRAYITGPRRP
ncbi:hypothetical protein ACQPZP_16055 [Spirillospora sp. CA-142024]|uniref:hypothetical protein n=1 Tax=Spirillospora sp. CA-142024 TaxID=3240036 RepID=UPI003D91EC64